MVGSYLVAFCLFWINCLYAADRESGELSYRINMRSPFQSCEGFDNKHIISTLQVMVDDDYSYWSGDLEFMEDIGRGTILIIETYKKNENLEEEFVSEIAADICEAMGEEDVPWTPIVEVMGSDCPIEAKKYHFDNVTLSLDAVKGMMTREMSSEYRVQMDYMSPVGLGSVPEMWACFTFDMEIMEIKE